MRYTVYIIKSCKGKYYIGQTQELGDRMRRHNSNRSKATKNQGKWELVISVEVETRSEAVILETKLKKMKNALKAIAYLERNDSEHPD